jgi:hypothetical protein
MRKSSINAVELESNQLIEHLQRPKTYALLRLIRFALENIP